MLKILAHTETETAQQWRNAAADTAVRDRRTCPCHNSLALSMRLFGLLALHPNQAQGLRTQN
jgi:hypothetical protein